MREQRVRLVSEVRKCIVDSNIGYTKTSAGRWLIDPDFFLVQCIPIGECSLEIVDPATKEEYIMNVKFKSEFGVNAYRVRAYHRISLTIKSYVKIRFSQQAQFLAQFKFSR